MSAHARRQVTWEGLVTHVKGKTAAVYPEWFPGAPGKKWQQPRSVGNTPGAVVLVNSDMAKGDDTVWEWCENKHKQPSERLVIRGGSCRFFAWNCRAANRGSGAPGVRSANFGFRVSFVLD